MAGSIPPLVSSSPPPLCDYEDDDEEEDDDEFGMYTVAQDIDYNECISFEKKDNVKENHCIPQGEQDSTSQDSATDSGLCPDSEGMSPTPHSDDERTVKNIICDKLCQKTLDLPVLSSRLTHNCDSECDCSGTAKVGESASLKGLTNGFREKEDSFTEEVVEDFGNFENFTFSPPEKVSLDEQDIASRDISAVNTQQEIEESSQSQVENVVNNEQNKEICITSLQTVKSDESVESEEIASEKITVNLQPEFSSDHISGHGLHKIEQSSHIILNNVDDSKKEVLECVESNKIVNSDVDDDEFNDFASFTNDLSLALDETETNVTLNEQSKPGVSELPDDPSKCLQIPLEESDDEFSNFADFSSSDCAFLSAQSSNSLENVPHIPLKSCDDNSLRTDSEFQDWISVFPLDNSCEEVPSGELADILGKDDVVWSRLFPLEASPALTHQWANSLTNRYLLSALNIDSRNILFMPWNNSTVPRFAANLARGPLEPVKATEPMPLQPTPAIPAPILTMPSYTQESVPDAHFDWISSGLTNPLDSSHSSLLDLNFMMSLATHLTINPKPVLQMKKPVSVEAGNILSSLPDLSFMRKTYINFPINEA